MDEVSFERHKEERLLITSKVNFLTDYVRRNKKLMGDMLDYIAKDLMRVMFPRMVKKTKVVQIILEGTRKRAYEICVSSSTGIGQRWAGMRQVKPFSFGILLNLFQNTSYYHSLYGWISENAPEKLNNLVKLKTAMVGFDKRGWIESSICVDLPVEKKLSYVKKFNCPYNVVNIDVRNFDLQAIRAIEFPNENPRVRLCFTDGVCNILWSEKVLKTINFEELFPEIEKVLETMENELVEKRGKIQAWYNEFSDSLAKYTTMVNLL